MYQQTIDLNMIPSGVPPVVHVNQYETQLNAFIFNLYKGNEPFTIPNNAAVLFNGLKPDGNVFSFAAASTSGNTAICNCEQQMVPLAGTVVCELRVRTASEIIGTCNFILLVEEAPLHDDSVISETTIPLIEQAIDIAANLAEYIETTLDARDEAAASAAAAKESEDNAAIYNSNVEQTYASIETAKQNANTAAASATAAAAKLSNISAIATTLSEGSSATASYDSNTGVMTFGIPRGATGESGIQTPISGMYALAIDADGYLYCYSNDEITESMFYYDEEEGNLYWMSPTTPIVTSVSGNMVTFVNKSSAENAVDVTSDIAPIQSFNGYDEPWPTGGGKNLFDSSVFPSSSSSQNIIYLHYAVPNGAYTMSTPDFPLVGGIANVFFLTGSVSSGISSGSNGVSQSTPRTITVTDGYYTVAYRSTNDINTNNPKDFKWQIESGSTATSYSPYSNICPISGWNAVKVTRTGVNVCDEVFELGAIVNGNNYSSNNNLRTKNYIPVVGGQTFYSACPSDIILFQYDKDKTLILQENTPFITVSTSASFVVTARTRFIRFYTQPAYGTTYNHDISINYPSSDHDYHAYTGNTYSIAFPSEAGTVYGGTVDVTTGILTVDRVIKSSGWERTTIDSSGKCWRIGPLPGCINYGANENVSTICNSGPVTNLEQARAASGVCFADFANSLWVAGYANNPDALDAILPSLAVVYQLAEPITYQFTPQNIKILKGTNNIWSDSGDVTVKYNRWELE